MAGIPFNAATAAYGNAQKLISQAARPQTDMLALGGQSGQGSDFGKLLAISANAAPMRRNVTIDEVGNVAAFLLSDLASGMTAQITYVDCGVSQAAVAVMDAP